VADIVSECWPAPSRNSGRPQIGIHGRLPSQSSAYDRATGRLINWECGDRDERTFRRLFERLARWQVRLFCSESYVVYPLVLAVANRYQGKGDLKGNEAKPSLWSATTPSSGIGPQLYGGAPSSSPSPSP
jgi:hypothetical protein